VAKSVSHIFAKLEGTHWKQQSVLSREGEESKKRPREGEEEEGRKRMIE
jgi:hypothetical protein